MTAWRCSSLLALALLVAPARALAACTGSAQAVESALEAALQAYAAQDKQGVLSHMAGAEQELGCLTEPMRPALAARFHMVEGLKLFLTRDNTGAHLAFAAARRTDAGLTLPADIAPPKHSLQTCYTALPLTDLALQQVRTSAHSLLVDGQAALEWPVDWPAVVQGLDERGAVLFSAWVEPGGALPEGLERSPSAAGLALESDASDRLIRLEVEALRDDGRRLETGDQVRQGDRFKLYAQVSLDAHIYVIYQNSAGEEVVLPEDEDGQLLSPGQRTQLPAPGFVFQVDEHGDRIEVVHVIAASGPIPLRSRPAVEVVQEARRTRGLQVVADGAAADCSDGKSRKKRRHRGLEIVTEPESDGCPDSWYGDLHATVTGFGATIYTLTLDHR